MALLAAGLALAVNTAFNWAVPRPRPFLVLPVHVLGGAPPQDPSFRSDHAPLSAAVGMALLLGGMVRWGVAGFVGAVVLGLSRVVVGVHYPSDVVGGLLVGAVCGLAVMRAEGRLRRTLDLILRAGRRLRLA
jgi:undecaprenyl-diphosphatase